MSDKWHGGKGSKPRKVDPDKFAANWDKIFNKKGVKNGRGKSSRIR